MIRLVIVGGDHPRSESLCRELIASGLFQVEIQPRVNLEDLEGNYSLQSIPSHKYGRALSCTESCCALAHKLAQERLISTGGVVLEDDAVVLNYQALADYAAQVVGSDENILLNFSTTRCAEDAHWDFGNNLLIRTYGPTALAVGYAASRSEMQQLIESNNSLEYVADWPPTRAKHLRLKFPLIAHGYRNTQSLIGSTVTRRQVSLWQLLIRGHHRIFLIRIQGKLRFEVNKFLLCKKGARL